MTGLAVNENDLIVSLDIPPDQEKVDPGENLLLEVNIRKPIDGDSLSIINLEYSIKDLEGNMISSKKEIGAIAIKESEVTSLLVPTGTKPGVYVASVTVGYGGNTYVASKTFEVIGSKIDIRNIIKTFEVIGSKYDLKTILYSLIILLVLLILSYVIYRKTGHNKRNRKKKRRRH
ncbi:MAG: hypothetical protein AABX79_02375 [Nanoarchaeota archaeon]